MTDPANTSVTPCCSCRLHRLVYSFVSLRFIHVKKPYSFECLYKLCTNLGDHNMARFKSVYKHDKNKDYYLWFLNRKRSLCSGLEVFPKWNRATFLCTSSEMLQKLIRFSSCFLFSLFKILLTVIRNFSDIQVHILVFYCREISKLVTRLE
jgi:hypothetical protein